MKANSQPKNPATPLPVLESPTKDSIIIPACTLTTAQARIFRDTLQKLIDCNVANRVALSPTTYTFHWDLIIREPAQVIEVDLKTIIDLQRLTQIGDNLETSVIELVKFYGSESALNIILLPDVMIERPSYWKYTNQFAHTIRTGQELYPHVRVLFDKATQQLGIFCRKQKIKYSFMSRIAEVLMDDKTVFIPMADLPKTFKTNFAMLKHHLSKAIPASHISIKKFEDGVNIDLTS